MVKEGVSLEKEKYTNKYITDEILMKKALESFTDKQSIFFNYLTDEQLMECALKNNKD